MIKKIHYYSIEIVLPTYVGYGYCVLVEYYYVVFPLVRYALLIIDIELGWVLAELSATQKI